MTYEWIIFVGFYKICHKLYKVSIIQLIISSKRYLIQFKLLNLVTVVGYHDGIVEMLLQIILLVIRESNLKRFRKEMVQS